MQLRETPLIEVKTPPTSSFAIGLDRNGEHAVVGADIASPWRKGGVQRSIGIYAGDALNPDSVIRREIAADVDFFPDWVHPPYCPPPPLGSPKSGCRPD